MPFLQNLLLKKPRHIPTQFLFCPLFPNRFCIPAKFLNEITFDFFLEMQWAKGAEQPKSDYLFSPHSLLNESIGFILTDFMDCILS
ncbi:MAG: hypothetical protein ACKODM_04095, partial [Cytophagales bacterium]